MSRRVLLYGGSFNPPHLGHETSVRTAAASLGAEKILLIPAAEPPHKAMPAGSPSPEERLSLTRLAAAGAGAEVSDLELARGGVSYTSDTLREMKKRFPEEELVFLVGTDMLRSLPEWHEPETVVSLASIAVFARDPALRAAVSAAAERLRETFGAVVYEIPGEPVKVSSTEIRALLPGRGGREYLSDAVYGEIIRKRLYGAKPELPWLREKAFAHLKPKRVPHVMGVEETGVKLAGRWGADPGEAAEAAICHDITKKLTRDEQLRLCEKYAIMTDENERSNEKLLHAKTGAALAADLFGLEPHVRDAVRWHTTGRADMTLLEKITYLADYIEPNRSDFPGLEPLRAACFEDLDTAMELASRMSLHEVVSNGQTPHENTINAWRFYREALRARGLEIRHAEGVPDEPPIT